jgi:hypothetical protein
MAQICAHKGRWSTRDSGREDGKDYSRAEFRCRALLFPGFLALWCVMRIALTSSAAFHPLATAVIRRFRETHPEMAIDLNELDTADIIERTMQGQDDRNAGRTVVRPPE